MAGKARWRIQKRAWRRRVCGTLALAAFSTVPAAAASAAHCKVTGVEDAATLRLACPGGERVLRLAAVRAPRPGLPLEGGEAFGTEARDAVRLGMLGRLVEVRGDTV